MRSRSPIADESIKTRRSAVEKVAGGVRGCSFAGPSANFQILRWDRVAGARTTLRPISRGSLPAAASQINSRPPSKTPQSSQGAQAWNRYCIHTEVKELSAVMRVGIARNGSGCGICGNQPTSIAWHSDTIYDNYILEVHNDRPAPLPLLPWKQTPLAMGNDMSPKES